MLAEEQVTVHSGHAQVKVVAGREWALGSSYPFQIDATMLWGRLDPSAFLAVTARQTHD